MNLGGVIQYHTLLLNTVTQQPGGAPLSGYAVERFTPDPPPPTAYLEKTALKDGLDAGDVFLGGRTFGLVVTAYGTSAGDFWDKAQALINIFTPTVAAAAAENITAGPTEDGFLALTFFQPTLKIAQWPTSAYPNGIPMQYNVRPVTGPTYTLERDKDGGAVTDPRSKTFDIRLVAKDPRKIHTSEKTVAITTVEQNLTSQQYRGDYPNFPVVQITTSAAGHSAFALTIGGLAVALNLTGESTGVTLFWDYATRTLWDADYGTVDALKRTDLITTVAVAEGFSPVESGTTFLYSNGTGISSVNLRYNEAWA